MCVCVCADSSSRCLLAQTSFDKVIPIVQFRFDGLAFCILIDSSFAGCLPMCLPSALCTPAQLHLHLLPASSFASALQPELPIRSE